MSRTRWRMISGLVLAACAFLVFVRLGYYPLWDDEACTALLAKGVWLTGDSLAVQGRNVMAYGYGDMLFGLYDRVHPPLQLYVMAPFLGLFGQVALAPRVPMALCGLGVVALLLHWLGRDGASGRFRVIFCTLLLTNVALWLYFRQGRYYALGTLALTTAAYLYLHLPAGRKLSWRDLLPLGLVFSTLPLISSQVFGTFTPVFVVDYLLFGRRRAKFSASAWAALLVPPALATVFILLTWNPLIIAPADTSLTDKLMMVYRAFRDLNAAEMGVGALLLAAPLVGYLTQRPELIRGTVALCVILVTDGLVEPLAPAVTDFAQVRHLVPVIPLTMALGAGVILAAWNRSTVLGVALLLTASLTNALHWGALQPNVRLRSTPYLWAKELIAPPPDPYSAALAWISANTRPGDSIGVDPAYMRYTLMYHLPDRAYTWQLAPRHRARLPAQIADEQFQGNTPPDYFIAFGLRANSDLTEIEKLTGPYTPVDRIETYWRDMFRPEIIFRFWSGEQMTHINNESIHFYKRPQP